MQPSAPFSSPERKSILEKIQAVEHDLLIIGGGITGAGIALDAASRGLKVALIEKSDFSSGTSSRSTKLVHGGLRYLQQLEFLIVYQVGHERDLLHRNAAHLVIPEKMFLPIIKGGSMGKITAKLGLTVYDFLAGVKKEERNISLNKMQTLQREPLLNQDLIKGGVLYYEYKTSDSRLTIETCKKAAEYGALMVNYVKAEEFIYDHQQVSGLKATDEITGEQINIYGKTVVNATGPWVDHLREKDHSLNNKRLHLTKGVHLVVSNKVFPVQHANYFDVDDGRMIFVIPRDEKVYIGTTDTDYQGDLNQPGVTKNDALYLLNAVNRLFPGVKLSPEHIESAWAGLRPLIHKEGKSPSELSRKDEVFVSRSGLISIAGGKLTGYRIMAKKITDLVMKKLKKQHRYQFQKCVTKNIKLSGGEINFKPDTRNMQEYFDALYGEALQTGIQPEEFRRLFYRYGTNTIKITEKAYDYYNQIKDSSLAWLNAELWYVVNYEMTVSLEDFFIRRTEMLYFDIDRCKEILETTAEIIGNLSGWSATQKEQNIEKFKTNLTFIV